MEFKVACSSYKTLLFFREKWKYLAENLARNCYILNQNSKDLSNLKDNTAISYFSRQLLIQLVNFYECDNIKIFARLISKQIKKKKMTKKQQNKPTKQTLNHWFSPHIYCTLYILILLGCYKYFFPPSKCILSTRNQRFYRDEQREQGILYILLLQLKIS